MSNYQDQPDVQKLPVYRSSYFRCENGVAEGDGISFADELVLDDIYEMQLAAPKEQIAVRPALDEKSFLITSTSPTGTEGNAVYVDSCITLMAPDSSTFEAVILVEVEDGGVAEVYFMPFAKIEPKTGYRLVGIDRHTATTRLAEVACMSFARGTHITMASGAQVKVEDLKVGDRVLTRDEGPRAIRWIGTNTIRAVGDFAPVVIRKGALNNEHDLWLSPEHRIFVYQREDNLGVGRSEVLIKVRHLINGNTVFQKDGGFVDYFQLLFDEHQIIYAEGIATETLLVDPRTRGVLPEELSRELSGNRGGQIRPAHLDYEVQDTLVAGPDTAELLRRASRS